MVQNLKKEEKRRKDLWEFHYNILAHLTKKAKTLYQT